MTEAPHCGPILIVDDDDLLRAWLCDLLLEAGYGVRSAATGLDAVRSLEHERPAIAILDVCLPDLSGYEICHRLRERYRGEVPVLFISGERTEAVDRVAGLRIGGDDYVVKPFAPDELLARVGALLRRSEQPRLQAPPLTPREREVFELLAHGLRNAEIGRRLGISPKTVGTHIEHIYDKLGVRSRVEALAAGYRHELLAHLSE